MKKGRERQGMPLSVENTLSRHPDSLIATCPHNGRKRSMEFPYQAAWSSGVSKEERRMFRMRAYLIAGLSDIKKPVGLQVLRAGTTRQQDSLRNS
jgi:hypothetical protein